MSSNAKDHRLPRYSHTANKGLHARGTPGRDKGEGAVLQPSSHCQQPQSKPATSTAAETEGFPRLSEQKALKKVVHFELIPSSGPGAVI